MRNINAPQINHLKQKTAKLNILMQTVRSWTNCIHINTMTSKYYTSIVATDRRLLECLATRQNLVLPRIFCFLHSVIYKKRSLQILGASISFSVFANIWYLVICIHHPQLCSTHSSFILFFIHYSIQPLLSATNPPPATYTDKRILFGIKEVCTKHCTLTQHLTAVI